LAATKDIDLAAVMVAQKDDLTVEQMDIQLADCWVALMVVTLGSHVAYRMVDLMVVLTAL
jgi:hypothetical protein